MPAETPPPNRRSDQGARKAPKRTSSSRHSITRSRLAKAAAFLGGGLTYGLVEGAGIHLWEPASAAVQANAWTWPPLMTLPVLVFGFGLAGRGRVASILRWIVSKLEGGM